MFSRVILIPPRLKHCSRENTAKSDPARMMLLRFVYIQDDDIIHTRRAFIKKLWARAERCDRGLRSDPSHNNPPEKPLTRPPSYPRLATLSDLLAAIMLTMKTLCSVTLQRSPYWLYYLSSPSLTGLPLYNDFPFYPVHRSFLRPTLYYSFRHNTLALISRPYIITNVSSSLSVRPRRLVLFLLCNKKGSLKN